MAAKKTAKKRSVGAPKTSAAAGTDATPKRGAKTASILAYRFEVPSRTIVDEGAKLIFGQNYVSAIRMAAKKPQAEGAAPKEHGRPAKVQAASAPVKRGRKPNALGASTDEQSHFSLILRLETAKAEDMLKGMRV